MSSKEQAKNKRLPTAATIMDLSIKTRVRPDDISPEELRKKYQLWVGGRPLDKTDDRVLEHCASWLSFVKLRELVDHAKDEVSRINFLRQFQQSTFDPRWREDERLCRLRSRVHTAMDESQGREIMAKLRTFRKHVLPPHLTEAKRAVKTDRDIHRSQLVFISKMENKPGAGALDREFIPRLKTVYDALEGFIHELELDPYEDAPELEDFLKKSK